MPRGVGVLHVRRGGHAPCLNASAGHVRPHDLVEHLDQRRAVDDVDEARVQLKEALLPGGSGAFRAPELLAPPVFSRPDIASSPSRKVYTSQTLVCGRCL